MCTCIPFSVLRYIYPAQLLVNPLFAYIRYIVQYPLVPNFQTCQQRAKKKSENCGSSTEARHASRVTQLGGLGGRCEPPNFFDIFNCSKID